MKSLNHHLKPYIFWGILLLAVLFIYLTWGCNTPKQIAKKDQAAVQRVNANADLQNKVASKWLDAHPPIEGKPEIKYIQGETIIQKVQDTSYKKHLRDSLQKVYSDSIDCAEAAMNSFNLGYDEGLKDAPKSHRTDTIQKTIPDLREANRWRDSSNYWKNYANYLMGIKQEKQDQLSQIKKELKAKEWLNILLFILLGLSIAMNVKSAITRLKLPKL